MVPKYDITLTANPSEGGNVIGGGKYQAGQVITVNAVPNEEYTFQNWTENGTIVSTNAAYSFTVNSNRTLVAAFELNTYTVTVSASPAAGGTVTGSGTYDYNTSVTVTATPKSGYSFNYWKDANNNIVSLNSSYTFNVTKNTTLVGVFTINTYVVAVEAIPSVGGNVTGGGTYNHGTSVTVHAIANTGYTFKNWSENGSSVSTQANYTFTVSDNHYLYANFDLKSYTITATASPVSGGNVIGGGTYKYGQIANMIALANIGYTFANWTENGTVVSTSASYVLQVVSNHNFVANFTLNTYVVRITVSPFNSGTVTGAGTYSYGEAVTVTATPAPGFKFMNWLINGVEVSKEASYTFTITNNVNLVAKFVTDEGIGDDLTTTVTLYPNPTSNYVNIKCAGMTNVSLLTSNGVLVREVKDITAGSYVIDMSNLGSGTYIVKIKTSNGCITKKVIKL